jgi:ribosomal protein S18 acetylase RimI-like enzyme
MASFEALHLREYTSADRDACLAIFDSNRPRYFADHERAEFAEWLDKPDRASYSVIEIDGDIVAAGGIFYCPKQNHVGLAWGMVHNALHGQGIGRRLTEFRVEQMGQQFAELEQRLATSQHTFRFYEKMGFTLTNVTADGFGKGIDRYDMVRPRPAI